MERAIKSVNDLFAFRKFDVRRITILRGGFREYNTVDSWLLFDDAAPPNPTVDKGFVEIPQPVKKPRSRK